MELAPLLEALARPAAYPEAVEAVEVRQTHISAVFLAGGHVYKLKKPVRLGFVDFGTPERRRHFCEEEVRLNRRLAPGVYLGVVPVTLDDRGRPRFEGPGAPIDWAVKIVRLPEEARLESRLLAGDLDRATVEDLARRVAAFHASAATGPEVAAMATFEAVARNARENFEQSAGHVGSIVSAPVFGRLRDRTEAALATLRATIDDRARRGVPRDTHGDLRLDHVYLPPGGEPVVIDCIEFSERFRFADPVADMAFPVMDLTFHGRRDLAAAFAEAYFAASGDDEGRTLLPFYAAYRAVVRAKVEGIEALEPEVPEAERADALRSARGHWLLALGMLEPPETRPALLLVGGLPGTGKSTLARALGESAGFEVIRSDVVRKQLAGLDPTDRAGASEDAGLYTADWNDRTYAECLARAGRVVQEGGRAIVDATFRERGRRRAFLEAARAWGVPGGCLICTAAPETVRDRLERRSGDASDADWGVYQRAASRWEPDPPGEASPLVEIPTDDPDRADLDAALAWLRTVGLLPDA